MAFETKYSEEQRENFRKVIAEGLVTGRRFTEMAKELGISFTLVQYYAKKTKRLENPVTVATKSGKHRFLQGFLNSTSRDSQLAYKHYEEALAKKDTKLALLWLKLSNEIRQGLYKDLQSTGFITKELSKKSNEQSEDGVIAAVRKARTSKYG